MTNETTNFYFKIGDKQKAYQLGIEAVVGLGNHNEPHYVEGPESAFNTGRHLAQKFKQTVHIHFDENGEKWCAVEANTPDYQHWHRLAQKHNSELPKTEANFFVMTAEEFTTMPRSDWEKEFDHYEDFETAKDEIVSSLLVDDDDSDFIKVIADTHSIIHARFWMKKGIVYQQNADEQHPFKVFNHADLL